jgi:hypothetical protein
MIFSIADSNVQSGFSMIRKVLGIARKLLIDFPFGGKDYHNLTQ